MVAFLRPVPTGQLLLLFSNMQSDNFFLSKPLTISLPKSRRQNFRLQIFKKVKHKLYIILRIQRATSSRSTLFALYSLNSKYAIAWNTELP